MRRRPVTAAWALGRPLVAQGLLSSALALVDLLWIGALGTAALAACALVAKLQFIGVMLSAAVSSMLTVRVAQATGAGDTRRLPGLWRAGLVTGALLLAPLALLQALAPQAVAALLSPDADVRALAASWLAWGWAFIPLTAATMGAAAFLRGRGDTRSPLLAGLVALALNTAALALWLQFGAADAAQGMAGAALIQVAARGVELAVLLVAPAARRARAELPRHVPPAALRQAIAGLLVLAAPVLVNELLWAGARFVHELVLARVGTSALAAYALAMQAAGLATVVFGALGTTTGILVARELGAGRSRRALRVGRVLTRRIVAVAAVAGVAVATVALLARGAVDTVLARDTLLALALLAAAFGLKAWNAVVCLGLLRSAHDGAYTLKVEVVATWGIEVPLTAFVALGLGWPLPAVLAVMLGGEVAKALLYRARLSPPHWTGRWDRLRACTA
jgi:Na+-driven multidrug efflux pump